jgi:ABC-2 type transport system ATP-binding protein
MEAVVANNLVKQYKTGKQIVKAVRGISFSVEKGELFGIIGPDGAGKTSLFRMLTTLLLPDGGTASVDGSDIVKEYKAIRNKVGYMPGRFSLYQDLTIEENLEFFATIFNTSVNENYDLIKSIYVQIEPFKTRRAGKLSGGMKQKLALCCALIHRPVVLFLDEPTTGVDAVSRKEFWEMLQDLKQQGITILVSTPYMDEAALCDRVVLIQEGNMLSIGTPAEITGSFSKKLIAVRSEKMYPLLKDLPQWKEIEDSYSFGEYHHAIVKEGFNKEALKKFLEDKGHQNLEMHSVQPNIEDCFLHLMKQ